MIIGVTCISFVYGEPQGDGGGSDEAHCVQVCVLMLWYSVA